KNKGKLGGKFVLLGDPTDIKPHEKLQYQRYDEKSLADLSQYEIPGGTRPRFTREEAIKRREFSRALLPFLAEEKPLAVIVPGGGDYGNIHVQGVGSYRNDQQYPAPALVLTDEQYGYLDPHLDMKYDANLEHDVRR